MRAADHYRKQPQQSRGISADLSVLEFPQFVGGPPKYATTVSLDVSMWDLISR
jgi:hypothetical protein